MSRKRSAKAVGDDDLLSPVKKGPGQPMLKVEAMGDILSKLFQKTIDYIVHCIYDKAHCILSRNAINYRRV